MTVLRRCFYVITLLFVVGCASSGHEATTPDRDAGAPQLAPTSLPSVVAIAQNPAAPTVASLSEPAHSTADIQLWFPKVDVDGLHPALHREINLAQLPSVTEKTAAVIDAWLRGPTDAERDLGVIGFGYRFRECGYRFDLEIIDDRAVVTLCDRNFDDGRVGEALAHTLIETGLVDQVAVLAADGRDCIGEPGDSTAADDPLWCLADADRVVDGFRCPFTRQTSTALVTGVDEWANARLEPSLLAPITDQVRAGTLLKTYPSTLQYDGIDHWWITAQLYGPNRCGSVAAHLLDGTFGNLGDVVPGVEFDLPTTGTWTFAERASGVDPARWNLEDSFATGVSIEVLVGDRFDQILAAQQARFVDEGDTSGEDRFREANVAGADRAVRYASISESGDSGFDVVLAQVGDLTLSASTSVYVEDEVAHDELNAFLQSIRIDRQRFTEAFAVPAEQLLTLHGHAYQATSEVAIEFYTGMRACGTPFEYFAIDDAGRRTRAGSALSDNPSQLANGYLLWEVYCEGAEPVIFAVAQVQPNGSIAYIGSVSPQSLGVRGEFGAHQVQDDGSIIFRGEPFGSTEIFTDTFDLDDLLTALGVEFEAAS